MSVDTAPAASGWAAVRRSPAVVRLSASVSVSEIGNQVTLLSLPLLALLQLHAGAAVVGMLTAAAYAPWVVLALPAGALADGWSGSQQLRVLVLCDAVRAALLLAVPALHATGHLTPVLLLVDVLVVGAVTVLAEITAGALVPEVVERHLLARVNGVLESARSLAMVVGPALAGALVSAVGAAQAVTTDALSFAVSAVLLARIPARQRVTASRPGEKTGVGRMIREGVSVLRHDPVLAPLCLWSTTSNLLGNALTPVLLTLVVREAHLPAGLLGASLAVAAFGGVAGALASGPLATRVGHGRFVGASGVVLALGILAVGALGVAGPPHGLALAGWLAAAYGVTLAANLAGNAQVATIRQYLVPAGALGRVIATWRTLGFAGIPVGAVVGGLLADAVGLRPVVVGAAIGFAVTCALPLVGPVRRLRLTSQTRDRAVPG